MKAAEVIKRYEAGERDFRRLNLRGQSFKGKNLSGADFRECDIRGTNFTNANLKEANFSYVKAGLQRHLLVCLWLFFFPLTGAGFLVSLLACFFSIMPIYSSANIDIILIETNWNLSLSKEANFVYTTVIFLGTIWWLKLFYKDLLKKEIIQAFIKAILNILTTITISNILLVFLSMSLGQSFIDASVVGIIISLFQLVAMIIAIIAIIIVVFTESILRVLNGDSSSNAICIFFQVLCLAFVVVNFIVNLTEFSFSRLLLYITFFIFLFLIYISGDIILWISFSGHPEGKFFYSFATKFCSRFGTCFQGADLKKANFLGAKLKNTNFTKANLTCVSWVESKFINFACTESTYLENILVRELVVTGQGQDQNFDGLFLRGVNLQGANLADACFIGADLSEASLQDADLSRANLKQTQLDETDFTGATLTGAYIEDWGITRGTKFDGVRCEYVFMRVPTKQNPDPLRKPDNNKEVFKDGDFGDFIKPIVDTLDLYHNQGVDPRAIAISFKQLAENHPEAELRIVGTEVRGEDKFLLRVKTAESANKSELSAEYFATYRQIKALAEQEVQALMLEKDNRIRSLETMVTTALQRPSFYAETYHNKGDTSVSERKIDINQSSASIGVGYSENVEAEQIGGTIHNYAQEQNLVEAAAEIQKLLNQLSETNPTTTLTEKMEVVTQAVEEIEKNPDLKARVISALKAGGTEAFKEAVDNPLVNVLVAAIEGWIKPE